MALAPLEDDRLGEAGGETRGHGQAHDAGPDDGEGSVGHAVGILPSPRGSRPVQTEGTT